MFHVFDVIFRRRKFSSESPSTLKVETLSIWLTPTGRWQQASPWPRSTSPRSATWTVFYERRAMCLTLWLQTAQMMSLLRCKRRMVFLFPSKHQSNRSEYFTFSYYMFMFLVVIYNIECFTGKYGPHKLQIKTLNNKEISKHVYFYFNSLKFQEFRILIQGQGDGSPIIESNHGLQFLENQGSRTGNIITTQELHTIDDDTPPSRLKFVVRAWPQYGRLETTINPGVNVTFFTQG